MEQKSRPEQYQSFLELIRAEAQRERMNVNRRMMGVFVWCFLAPFSLVLAITLLIKAQMLPSSMRGYSDWVILAFPVLYATWFLGVEVMRELPANLKLGAVAAVLKQNRIESEWRVRTCQVLEKGIAADTQDWEWIAQSFAMDLEIMQQRTRYLTALAGAIFFLIMPGMEALSDSQEPGLLALDSAIIGFSQLASLGLFLLLLFLAGSQTTQFLKRYLNCARLLAFERKR